MMFNASHTHVAVKQAELMTVLSIMHLELFTDDKWICTSYVEQDRFEFIWI